MKFCQRLLAFFQPLRHASLKTVVLVVLILISIASMAVIGVRASQIYSLAAASRDGLDLSEVSVKVTGTGGSFYVANFLPLAQAFAGGNFSLEGATSLPPGTTFVSIFGKSISLPPYLGERGWAFSQVYSDENTFATLMEDDKENAIAIAAIEVDNPNEFVSEVRTQYYDLLTLFGFDVDTSDGTITAQQEDLTIKAQVWNPPGSNTAYIAVLSASGEPSTSSQDFDAIGSLLQG